MTKQDIKMSHIEKLPLTSMDIKESQIEKLKEFFPEVFTEGNKIDWDKLKLTLGENVDIGKERFGMNWPGKADCFKTIQQPSIATLVPSRADSVDFDNSQNLFIEGDNLEVLKLLQKSYLGKIKIIYIDPPYNTGTDFIYPDNYAENLTTYLEYTGQVNLEGKKFSTNTETNGRFHSKWINMLYPRLFLARNLLREDGLIFISIDDTEVNNLRAICNEIFGEEHFVEQIIWKNKYNAGALTKGFSNIHEYILCYSKSLTLNIEAPLSEEEIKKYDKKDEKFSTRGGYVTQPLATGSKDERPNLRYPIIYEGVEIWPEKQWLWSKERVLKAVANNEIVFNKSENSYNPRVKQYLKDDNGVMRKGKPVSILIGPYNQEGSKEIKEILQADVFDFPKPSSLLKYLISLSVNNSSKSDGIYLDFFAGSGSLGQAVLELNEEDQGTRKFICIQLPEICEPNSKASKAGFNTIADIAKERIRRVINRIKAAKGGTLDLFKEDFTKEDLGFKVFKLQPSNFKVWDAGIEKNQDVIQSALEFYVDHIVPGVQQESILCEILLKAGFELTTQIEELKIQDKTLFSISNGELLVCLEKDLTTELIKAIAEKQPTRVICLDDGFHNNDQLKTNAVQIMKSKNIISFRTV